MKKVLLTLIAMAALAATAYSQTASFSFNDNNGAATSGSYLPTDTFTLSTNGSLTGIPAGFSWDGFSLWMEAPTTSGFNTAIQITGVTPFQFTNPNQTGYPKTFTDASGAQSASFRTTIGGVGGDLGFTDNGGQSLLGGGSNVHLADYAFSLSGAAPGTYTIFSTITSPKQSENSYNDGTTFTFATAPAAAYTITIVPEPATWSLLGLGGLAAVGLSVLRRRRVS
jgi:hypothetical protein